MTHKWPTRSKDHPLDVRWSPMVGLSILFHLALFSTLMIAPYSSPRRAGDGIIYEVNLVDMPAGKGADPQEKGSPPVPEGKLVAQKNIPAKRIESGETKEPPVVIGKKTVEKKTSPIEKPKTSTSELIEKAISRIKGKVQTEQRYSVDDAISKIKNKVEGGAGAGSGAGSGGGGAGGAGSGIPVSLYQMEVENRVKSNWSFPVGLTSQKDLEAIMVLMVKSDGAILKTQFQKHSSDPMFDQSVIRAIERSDPLPPFPEGYGKNYEEIQITFNLKDFEAN